MLKKSCIAVQIFVLLFVVPGWTQGQEPFDRTAFYKTMKSDVPAVIDGELLLIKNASFTGKQAFEGCLLMKKAGLIGGLIKKLNLFKAGHRELEGSIAMDSMNTEYRFLRMMIQEHAPAIVEYRKDLDRDNAFIIRYFKSLDPEVQDAIIGYSKKSRILKPADF
jgi:hypothetical protein